ncbi:AfsR/SARP family transcriptional regulator [Micromonospora sp. CA-259024]|uniref:AfsR/SARP family transcriptional regulator n=1 Tax=Micromonospora sp. CA-259024 TaxID=3239965 RepID=UPI003D8C9E97
MTTLLTLPAPGEAVDRDSRPVALRLLGPLEIVVDGEEVPLPQRKLRQLLAALLIRANTTASNELLIRELWGDRPPPTALAALRVYVSQLRKFLVRHSLEGRCTLGTRAPGYRMQVADGILDVALFEQQCARALASAEAGHLELASQTYHEALALRRGPALEDLRDSPVLAGAALQHDEAWATALKRRIDLDLMLGRHLELVGELRRLVVEDPLNEVFCARLMVALYRSGRSGDALAFYRRTRAKLIEELGIEPGLDLRLAHQAVLTDDAGFQLRPRIPA